MIINGRNIGNNEESSLNNMIPICDKDRRGYLIWKK
jgi:hypothetical protein